MVNLILQIMWYILPAYFANSTPVVIHGRAPLDFNKKFVDGKPLFGKGKTIVGSIAGIVVGTVVGFVQYYLQNSYQLTGYMTMSIQLAFLLSTGVIVGDILGSFIKRRLDKGRGTPMWILDRFDFIVGALFFSSFIYIPDITWIVILLIITPLIHRITNFIAYKIKIKEVPW